MDFGPGIVYSVSFSGFADKETVFRLQKKFRQDLEADGVDYDPTSFYTAVFNNPWTMTDRHNELYYLEMRRDDDEIPSPGSPSPGSPGSPSSDEIPSPGSPSPHDSSPNSPQEVPPHSPRSLPTDNSLSDDSQSDGNSSDNSDNSDNSS